MTCLILYLVLDATRDTQRDAEVVGLVAKFSSKDQDQYVRLDAIRKIQDLGPKGRHAIPELITALADKNRDIATEAAYALVKIGPDAFPALVKALDSDDKQTRYWAIRHMDRTAGWDTKIVVPVLIKALRHCDEDVRLEACRGLYGCGDKRAIQPLLDVARNEQHEFVRGDAILAVASFGPDAAPAIPFFMKLLSDEAPIAVDALAPIGKGAVPPLLSLLQDKTKSSQARSFAILCLSRMDLDRRGDMKDAVPVLIGLLRDEDEWICEMAVRILGTIGKQAATALPVLKVYLRKDSIRDQLVAAEAIYLISRDPDTVLPSLLRILRSPNALERAAAASIMDTMKGDAWSAMPQLIEACRDPDANVRTRAVHALNAMGKLPEIAMKALRERLNDPDSWVRTVAESALRSQSANPKPRSP